MSSFDFRGLKPSSNNPLAEAVVRLQQQVARSMVKDQVSFVDSDNEDLYTDGVDMESVIKYHSDLSPTHQFNFRTDYYPPEEPNGTTVKCMLKGWNTGNEISDESGFGNHAEIWGDPTLVNGVLDLGIWNGTNSIKSIALRLNRPTSGLENAEYLIVPDSSSMKISDCTVGFSEHIRFKIFDIAQQHSKNRTILVKRDDITATPNDGRLVMVDDTGHIIFVVRDGGVTYAKITNAASLATVSTSTGNDMFDIYITYDASSHTQHIYLGTSDLTLSNYGGTITWPETTDTDLNLFRRHDSTDGGYTYGDFYTYRLYKEKILSSTEVSRHFTNKWTIADIPFGKVMIAGYWATYQDTSGSTRLPSFTTTSFSSSSFTTV